MNYIFRNFVLLIVIATATGWFLEVKIGQAVSDIDQISSSVASKINSRINAQSSLD